MNNTVELKTDNGWIKVNPEQIVKGDIFRLVDENGKIVEWDGGTVYKALYDAQVDSDGEPYSVIEKVEDDI